ncbi:cation transporting ATPase C-terminal domain-containing protein [Nesterenkonia haasae]|uniref:cation transporting ATPase C-terminal domain-containing protein n=1 Tax=Nesterenkonia haasae TaxID=2587813 RepID=UPI0038B2A344
MLGLTVLQLLFIYAPRLQQVVDSAPLSAAQIIVISCAGAAVFLATEALKVPLYRGRQVSSL